MDDSQSTDDLVISNCQFIQKYGERLTKIGHGSYATIYSTIHGYATKQIIGKSGDSIRADFIREVTISQHLHHPNVVPIESVVMNLPDNLNHIIMPLGVEPLSKAINKDCKKFTLKERQHIIYQIIRGLAYCHSRFIWQLDVKPDNVVKFPDGSYKLIDFGISEIQAISPTQHSTKVSTIPWKAPELILGDPNYTETVDLWAVGIILLEILVQGQYGYTEDEQEQWEKICKLLGTPNEDNWPGIRELRNWPVLQLGSDYSGNLDQLIKSNASSKEQKFLRKLLTWPVKRLTAFEALNDPYFNQVRQLIELNYPAPTIFNPNRRLAIITAQQYLPSYPLGKRYSQEIRLIAFNWIWGVNRVHQSGYPKIFFLSCYIFDMSMSKIKLVTRQYQLALIVSYMIASKIFYFYDIAIQPMISLTDDAYTKSEVTQMEYDILKVLNFKLIIPTCATFIDQLEAEDKTLIYALTTLMMTHIEWPFKYLPSDLVQSAINIAVDLKKLPTTLKASTSSVTANQIRGYINSRKKSKYALIEYVSLCLPRRF